MAICEKCDSAFEQRADVWPQGFCEHCRLVPCDQCGWEWRKKWQAALAAANKPIVGKFGLANKDERDAWLKNKKELNEQWKKASLDPPPFLFIRDPFEYFGWKLCKRHRGMHSICHGCGAIYSKVALKECAQCHAQEVPFCSFCFDNQRETRKLICIPESDKIAPSYTAPIDFSQIRLLVSTCPLNSVKKPLVAGQLEVLLRADCTLDQAKADASVCYQKLLDLVTQLASKQHKPSLENTFAIALLENDAHFKVILTYSDYSKVNVAKKVRDHGTLGDAVIDADPLIQHHGGDVHTLFEVGQPPSPLLAGRNGERYQLKNFNLHHAELRAVIFASKNQYRFLYLAPTRVCCGKCKDALTTADLLNYVPEVMREQKKKRIGPDIDDEEKKEERYERSVAKKSNPSDEGTWIEDETIKRFYERLALKHPQYRFVNPVIAHQIASERAGSAEALAQLQGLNLDTAGMKRIFFPINNRDELNSINGTHWTLLVFDVENEEFQYYDTSPGEDGGLPQAALNIMNHLIKPESALVWTCPDAPRQQNGNDCGVFVMSITEHLAGAYAANNDPNMENIEPPAATRLRLRELELD